MCVQQFKPAQCRDFLPLAFWPSSTCVAVCDNEHSHACQHASMPPSHVCASVPDDKGVSNLMKLFGRCGPAFLEVRLCQGPCEHP